MQADEFKMAVWQFLATVPSGRVVTYGQIAKQLGYPNYARRVGWVLKHLPADTQLPWHRVVNSKGQLSFPVGSNELKQQKARLLAEGVRFSGEKLTLD